MFSDSGLLCEFAQETHTPVDILFLFLLFFFFFYSKIFFFCVFFLICVFLFIYSHINVRCYYYDSKTFFFIFYLGTFKCDLPTHAFSFLPCSPLWQFFFLNEKPKEYKNFVFHPIYFYFSERNV